MMNANLKETCTTSAMKMIFQILIEQLIKDVKTIKNTNNTKEEDIEAIEELKNLED
jgi:hypothetical protein